MEDSGKTFQDTGIDKLMVELSESSHIDENFDLVGINFAKVYVVLSDLVESAASYPLNEVKKIIEELRDAISLANDRLGKTDWKEIIGLSKQLYVELEEAVKKNEAVDDVRKVLVNIEGIGDKSYRISKMIDQKLRSKKAKGKAA